MSRKPTVSVVISFLNARQFIQEAIDGVFAQTYDDWELLLVDDGSADGSTLIAQQYAQRDPAKVRYLQHEGHQNLGASASRNVGSKNAKGEYIAFLDADDVWLPEKLEQQVAILESHPEAAMVYGQALCWRSWTGDPEDLERDYVRGLGVPLNAVIEPPKLITAFVENEDATPFPSSVLVRRSTDRAIGGFEEACRSIYDDQVYAAKVGLETPVFASGNCWHRYRLHPNQRVHITVQEGEYHSARLTFLNWLQEYLSGKVEHDSELWRVLQKELWPYRHPNLSDLVMYAQLIARRVQRLLTWTIRRTLPPSAQGWLRSRGRTLRALSLIGQVRFRSLRRP